MCSGPGLICRTAVLLVRLALAFWVGGAALFVITSVAEQRHPRFDSVVRDELATIRFPLYYQFGWACLAVAGVASLVAMAHPSLRRRMLLVLAGIILSASIALGDYVLVYGPLQKLIDPPGQVRNQEFITLHNRSRMINEVHLSIALLAVVFASWPAKPSVPDSAKIETSVP
jgi:hypothetical protein